MRTQRGRLLFCQRPSCNRSRQGWQVMCTPCWNALPQEMRARFFSTKPHSTERRARLREVWKYVLQRDKQGRLDV